MVRDNEPLDVGGAGLHGVLARAVNLDVALFDVLLGDTLVEKRPWSIDVKLHKIVLMRGIK